MRVLTLRSGSCWKLNFTELCVILYIKFYRSYTGLRERIHTHYRIKTAITENTFLLNYVFFKIVYLYIFCRLFGAALQFNFHSWEEWYFKTILFLCFTIYLTQYLEFFLHFFFNVLVTFVLFFFLSFLQLQYKILSTHNYILYYCFQS